VGRIRTETAVRVTLLWTTTTVMIGGAVRQPGHVRSAAAALVSAALLLVGVVAGFAPGAAAPVSQTSGSSSSSSIPTLAVTGTRSAALTSDRRQAGVLSTFGSPRQASGGSPVDPPPADLPAAGWRQPTRPAHSVVDAETSGFAVSVPGTQRSRAPPAGITPE
jgi:hypothetical protein